VCRQTARAPDVPVEVLGARLEQAPEVVPEEPRRLQLSEGRPRLEVRKSQERDAEQPGPVAEPVRLALAPLLSSSSDTHSCGGYFGPTGRTNPGEHVI